MTRSQITLPCGKVRAVKNLGWLLRHWKEVESFTVDPHPDTPRTDCILRATMRDGTKYETDFASASILNDWLHRPVFRGLPVQWNVAVKLSAQRDGRDGVIPAGLRAA